MKITIERVANGWVTVHHTGDSDDPTEIFVFSDTEDNIENHEAESLSRVLWEAFGYLHQSKHEAGLLVDYKDISRSKQEEIEYEELDAGGVEWTTGTGDSD